MINKLKLDFSIRVNPFEQDKNAGLVWGKIDLNVVSDGGQIIEEVVNMTWDIKELIQWVIKNEDFFYYEDFPQQYNMGGESLAEIRYKYFEICRANDEIDDKADDTLEEYATRHSIRYGMSGTKTRNIYIGKGNGLHEVSYFNNYDSRWVYNIDIRGFVDDAKAIAQKYLID